MTFFGITSFGPQNNFQTALINAIGINLFSEDEYLEAFNKIDKDGSGFITVDEIQLLLKEAYGFEPLEEEVQFFMEEFDANKDGKVSWQEFVEALEKIKENLSEKAKGSKQYSSNLQYYEDRFKHKRIDGHPNEKYKLPVTLNQEFGFEVTSKADKTHHKHPKNYPISKCDETKYAEEMIKTGVHFS